MNSALASISRWWESLTGSQKSMYIVMAGAVIAAAIFFVQWMGRVNYAPLFTQLDPREASGVVEKLKELNVKYQLADQGGTVLVPEEKVYELRMQMVGSGMLVGGGVGFEIFDKSKLGMTDFERRMDYLRALQEELRRTIVQVEEVEQARVHLVLPEPSVFIKEDRPASASVTLKLSPLGRLSPEQVKAIVYLVASAVENLPPENVKIIDTRGNILSDTVAVGDNSAGLTQQRMAQQEMKRAFERDIERRVQGMLERIRGQGKVVVMVSADLDFDQREITRIEYDDQGVIRTEQVRQEEGTNTGGAVGQAGMESNIISYPAQGTQGESRFNKEETNRTFEIGQTQERTVYAPGRLKSLSTAVTVDGVLDAQTEARIRDLVAAATGYQYSDDPSGRRDQITVMSMAFDNSQAAEAKKEMEAFEEARRKEERIRRYVAWGLQGLGTIMGFVVLLMIIRRIGSARSMVAVTLDEPIPVTQYMPPPLPPEEVQRREKQEKAKDIARQKPEEAAQLVKTWMAED